MVLNDDAMGNAAGWKPNGSSAQFLIQDPNVSKTSEVVINILTGGHTDANGGCYVDHQHTGSFDITCVDPSYPNQYYPPLAGSSLIYTVTNANIITR